MYRVAVMKKAGQYSLDTLPGLAQDKRFLVEPMCPGCAAAMDRLMKKPADLLLVDLRSHSDNGLEFIRRLRVKGVGVDVIALVPRSNARVMQRAFRLGVIDCLTEPHDGRHMRRALDRFVFRARLMRNDGRLTQEAIDSVLQGTVQEKDLLPKGLQETTLSLIRRVFEQRPKSGLSCEEVSSAVGLSRITVQRYLAYLCEKGELVRRMNYHTGGRPSTIYACRSEKDQMNASAMRQIV
jgi:response regulator of citrate/malate metabolism